MRRRRADFARALLLPACITCGYSLNLGWVGRAGLSHFLSSNVYLVGRHDDAMLRPVHSVTPPAVQEDLMHTDTAMPWRGAADTPDDDVALVRAAQQVVRPSPLSTTATAIVFILTDTPASEMYSLSLHQRGTDA